MVIDSMNKEEAIAAVSKDGMRLRNLVEWKADREVVMAAAEETTGKALQFASEALRADREVVMTYVALDGEALEFASEALRADKGVVMEAVSHAGEMLEFASTELQEDKEVVMAAMSNNGHGYPFASEELQLDREVIMEALRTTDGNVFEYFPENVQYDGEVVLEAAKTKDAYTYFPPEMINQEVITTAILFNGMALAIAGPLRANPHIVRQAISENGDAIQYAHPSLRTKEFAMIAVSTTRTGEALRFVSPLNEDKEVVLAAVMKKGRALRFASPELKADREVVLAAVLQDGTAIVYAGILDPQITCVACADVRYSRFVFGWLPDSIQKNNEFIDCIIREGIVVPNILADKDIPFGPDNDKFLKLKQRIRDRKSFLAAAKTFAPNGKEMPPDIVSEIKRAIGGTKRKRLKRKTRRQHKKRVTNKFAKD